MGLGTAAFFNGLANTYSQVQQGQASASGYESAAKQTEWLRDNQISALKGQTESTVSSQQAAMTANGLDINSATGTGIEAGTRLNANLDEAAIRYNANIQALQLRTQANQAKRSGKIAAASSLLGSAQQTYTGYQDYLKTSEGSKKGLKGYLWG